jgi:hypothetical protein
MRATKNRKCSRYIVAITVVESDDRERLRRLITVKPAESLVEWDYVPSCALEPLNAFFK